MGRGSVAGLTAQERRDFELVFLGVTLLRHAAAMRVEAAMRARSLGALRELGMRGRRLRHRRRDRRTGRRRWRGRNRHALRLVFLTARAEGGESLEDRFATRIALWRLAALLTQLILDRLREILALRHARRARRV